MWYVSMTHVNTSLIMLDVSLISLEKMAEMEVFLYLSGKNLRCAHNMLNYATVKLLYITIVWMQDNIKKFGN